MQVISTCDIECLYEYWNVEPGIYEEILTVSTHKWTLDKPMASLSTLPSGTCCLGWQSC